MSDKSPEIRILDEVRRGGYTASLMTTYNAYLPFYEQVVLRRLLSTGVRQNILLMDAGQCHHSISRDPPRFAGRSYSLLPMQSSEVFHPKVILLAGKHKGLLLVGSHNMTISGFGYNREISNAIRLHNKDDAQAIGLFLSAWQQIEGWLQAQQQHLPEELLQTVLAFPKSLPWMKSKHAQSSSEVTILSTQSGAASLWEQLLPHITAPVRRVLILGAFFDRQLAFITRVQQDLQPEESFVGIDLATVRVPPDVLKQQQGIQVVNVQRLGVLDDRQAGYIHAKCLVFQCADDTAYLVSGSANPTAAAWLKPGLSGNTEMVMLRQGAEAERAARAVGLLNMPEMPLLSNNDWQTVENAWQEVLEQKESESSVQMGIASVVDEGIRLSTGVSEEYHQYTFEVLDLQKQKIASPSLTHYDERLLQVSAETKKKVYFMSSYKEAKQVHLSKNCGIV